MNTNEDLGVLSINHLTEMRSELEELQKAYQSSVKEDPDSEENQDAQQILDVITIIIQKIVEVQKAKVLTKEQNIFLQAHALLLADLTSYDEFDDEDGEMFEYEFEDAETEEEQMDSDDGSCHNPHCCKH